jgi:ubiquinone/menaquinone biosynthesis C-methylase UbiE
MNEKELGRASPDFVYRIIELIHGSKLMTVIRDPYRLLKAAGLKPDLKIFEVGCGPGAFTIPAAEIAGKDGFIYAVDIHPLAIKRVKEKIDESGMGNVKPVLTDASNTGLSDQEIDLVFMFGISNIAGGLQNVLSEIHRILKSGGIFSFEKLLRSENKLIMDIENEGFVFLEKKGRIMQFRKIKRDRSRR